jgi:hypothetical protein
MAEQMRPASKEQAPDPSNNYERSHPENEAGMGRLDNNMRATPTPRSDQGPDAVKNAQDGSKQINAHEEVNPQKTLPAQPDHSMQEEEPLGWDQAPEDINDPRRQRQPRTGGKGGTPNVGEPDRDG